MQRASSAERVKASVKGNEPQRKYGFYCFGSTKILFPVHSRLDGGGGGGEGTVPISHTAVLRRKQHGDTRSVARFEAVASPLFVASGN